VFRKKLKVEGGRNNPLFDDFQTLKSALPVFTESLK